jgi:hypothetical protein
MVELIEPEELIFKEEIGDGSTAGKTKNILFHETL